MFTMKPIRPSRFAVRLLLTVACGAACCAGPSVSPEHHRVQTLQVRVLSTMLTDMAGVGEWGFSALVVADGHRILVDTGARPDTVAMNAREMNIDLTNIPEVVLTHNHGDHTGGLLRLREAVRGANSESLAVTHVGEGIFLKRDVARRDWMPMDELRTRYESLGGKIIVHKEPYELYPGVWLTGPVARKYPEKNFGIGPGGKLVLPNGSLGEDTIPEDMSLVIDTDRGLVVIVGCGHAGVINILDYARSKVREAPVHALVGGLHLFQLDDERLAWTAGKLKEFGMQNFLGAHCTGIEATYRIREWCRLSRRTAIVAATGSGFVLGEGIHPGLIAQ